MYEEAVKLEPADEDPVYVLSSNSDTKDLDSFGEGEDGQQQQFMDELLGHSTGSNQGHMVSTIRLVM